MKNPFDDDPLHHNNLSDIYGANAHSFGNSENPLQTDWTNPLPDAHPHSHNPNWTPQYEHHTFASAANSSVLRFESSSDSNKHPYITVSDSLTGHVLKEANPRLKLARISDKQEIFE